MDNMKTRRKSHAIWKIEFEHSEPERERPPLIWMLHKYRCNISAINGLFVVEIVLAEGDELNLGPSKKCCLCDTSFFYFPNLGDYLCLFVDTFVKAPSRTMAQLF